MKRSITQPLVAAIPTETVADLTGPDGLWSLHSFHLFDISTIYNPNLSCLRSQKQASSCCCLSLLSHPTAAKDYLLSLLVGTSRRGQRAAAASARCDRLPGAASVRKQETSGDDIERGSSRPRLQRIFGRPMERIAVICIHPFYIQCGYLLDTVKTSIEI